MKSVPGCLLGLLMLATAVAQEKIIREVQRSHIGGNAPEAAHFTLLNVKDSRI